VTSLTSTSIALASPSATSRFRFNPFILRVCSVVRSCLPT
jgi:hypothetical protein